MHKYSYHLNSEFICRVSAETISYFTERAEQDSSIDWQQMALLNKSWWNSSVWLGVVTAKVDLGGV